MITSTEPILPPIPNVPIADPATGRCSREWWVWFNQVAQVALAQQGLIGATIIFPSIAEGVDEGDVSVAALRLDTPNDAVNVDQVVMAAMMNGVPT